MTESLLASIGSTVGGILIGLTTFLISSALAWIFYKKALPISRIDFALSDVTIVDNAFRFLEEDIKIHFRGKDVPRITLTTVAFGTTETNLSMVIK